jgi:hypothetical protein
MANRRATKQITVAVFPFDARNTRFNAYTTWYNPAWKGCCEHVVEAVNGTFTMSDFRQLESGPVREWQIVIPDPVHRFTDGSLWVRVVARIRHEATGQIRYYDCDQILEPGERDPNDYIWSEGNYACDCNRMIFFNRGSGVEIDFDSTVCSDGAFAVQLINPMTGRVYYDEFEQSL